MIKKLKKGSFKQSKISTYNKYKESAMRFNTVVSLDVRRFLNREDFKERVNYLKNCMLRYEMDKNKEKRR